MWRRQRAAAARGERLERAEAYVDAGCGDSAAEILGRLRDADGQADVQAESTPDADGP